MDKLTIDKIQKYWSGKRVSQQWYSNKTPKTLQWFNDISKKRFNIISRIMYFFSLEKILGENWKIKLTKSKVFKGKISDVIFRNYLLN